MKEQNNPYSLIKYTSSIKPKKQASLKRINLTKPQITQYPRDQPTTNQQQSVNQLGLILKDTIMKMEIEESRQKLLKQVIKVMSCDSLRKKNDIQNKNQIIDIKRIQEEINNYSSINNQIVAKNKTMKDQILKARKNRAMFSVLFRDIEKEIQQNQNFLRKTLIQSQQMLSKYQMKQQEQNNLHNLQGNHELLSDTFNLNSNFFTEPTVTNQAINFYGGKKATTFIKPRKQYIGSMRNITNRDTNDQSYQNMTNFIQKVCSVAQMHIQKMKDAMGPNGLILKNDQLFKKVTKVNEHISKYQKKCQALIMINKNKQIEEKETKVAEKDLKIVHKQSPDDLQLYNQLLCLTNIKKPLKSQSNIMASSKDISNAVQIKNYQILKEKIKIIIQQPNSTAQQNIAKTQSCQNQNSNNSKEIGVNHILSNMKIFSSYQRAFERIQFQAEYFYQRNRKNKKQTTLNKK